VTIWTEIALQGGERINATSHSETRRAWATDLGMECRMWEEQYSWKPVFSSEYMFFSGENVNNNQNTNMNQFNPMFADGSSRGVIAGNLGTGNYYPTYMTVTGLETDSGLTNRHILSFGASVEPMENLVIDTTFYNFRLHENASPITDNKNIGSELDVEMTYEYTEDVTFGLLAAWFWAGDYFVANPGASVNGSGNNVHATIDRSVASEVVGTVAVSF